MAKFEKVATVIPRPYLKSSKQCMTEEINDNVPV